MNISFQRAELFVLFRADLSAGEGFGSLVSGWPLMPTKHGRLLEPRHTAANDLFRWNGIAHVRWPGARRDGGNGRP